VPNPADLKYRSLPTFTPPEAAQNAEIIVLATPWPVTEAAVRSLGNVSGKIIIDCTNPLGMGPDGLTLVLGHTTSVGEQVAGWAPAAAVFKTLNQIGADNMDKAGLFPVRPVMFVAGDDLTRKPVVMSLIAKLGFEAIDAGPLRIARVLEAYGMLWIDQALNRGHGRNFAFAITNRSDC
jgi:8-hydroxy-5-deazaflavin:NADPH oxidoreductase